MTLPHVFSESDYHTLRDAILNAQYPDVMETDENRQMISLSDPIPGVEIKVRCWFDGHWATGGTDDYGRREMLWEIDRTHYAVDSFEFFDDEGNDLPVRFDTLRLEEMLNT